MVTLMASGAEHGRIDEAGLAALYRPPTAAVAGKARAEVDAKAAAFIAASPLVVLATVSEDGTDASPRGGPPGFVAVLDPRTLAFGDLSGNNRLDSYRNLVRWPGIGMLFLVPGIDDTLRVNGNAAVSTDAAVLDAVTSTVHRPKVAVVVEVTECFVHCGKALRRGGVWDPSSWAPELAPNAAEVIVDQFDLDLDPGALAAHLEADLQTTLWRPGGQ